jgi:hypothetical protein
MCTEHSGLPISDLTKLRQLRESPINAHVPVAAGSAPVVPPGVAVWALLGVVEPVPGAGKHELYLVFGEVLSTGTTRQIHLLAKLPSGKRAIMDTFSLVFN